MWLVGGGGGRGGGGADSFDLSWINKEICNRMKLMVEHVLALAELLHLWEGEGRRRREGREGRL